MLRRHRAFRTVCAACAACAASSLAALPARAEEPPTARLVYTRGAGAAECPEEVELRGIVAARLGYDPFAADAERVIDVRIARQGRDLVGHLDVRGGPSPGSRDLASSTRDCRELVDSLAVAIAIGIDPLSLSRVPQALPTLPAAPASTTPAPTPAAAPPSARESPPSREEPAAVRSADPVHLRAGLGPVVSFGAAPSTNLGIRAQIGARWRAVSLGIEGRADFPVSQAAVDGGRVSASLLVGSLVPCVHRGVILGCLLGTFGAMRASGESVTSPLHEDKFYAAAGGRVGVEIPIGSFLAIQLHGDVLAPLTQITLRLNDRDVWTTPVVSGSLGASLAGTF